VAVRFWLAFVAVGPLKVTPIVAMISLVAPVSSASVMWLRDAPLTVNVAVGTSSLVSPLGAAKAAVPMVRSAPRCSPRAIRLIVQVFVSVSPGTISQLTRGDRAAGDVLGVVPVGERPRSAREQQRRDDRGE
jgi:hypothetical protein